MKHKILMKLGISLIALASTASVGATINAKPAKATVYKYNDKRIAFPKNAKLYVFHLKRGYHSYPLYDVDNDRSNNYNMILVKTHTLSTRNNSRTVIAPLSSKRDLTLNGIRYHAYVNDNTHGFMPESTFRKLFTKGGTFNDGVPEFGDKNRHMVNGKVYSGRKFLRYAFWLGANTPDKLGGAIGYKNRRYYEEDMALNDLDGVGVSVSDPDEDSQRVINRVVKALKSWGYSDALIQRILNRKKMCETYDDTHDDYNEPNFIQKWMYINY